MANYAQKWKQNADGKLFVDKNCIVCDACVGEAPENFEIDIDEGHAYVKKQPETLEEIQKCRVAMECCPVEAIGDNGDETAGEFRPQA